MSPGLPHHGPTIVDVRSRVASYGVAVAAAGLAAGANGALWPNFGTRYPLIAFYPAITISAWFGGLWPGVVCTILSSSIAAFVWLDPLFSLRITPGADAIAMLVFLGIGIVISAFSESLKSQVGQERAARDRAENAEALLATELADTRRLYGLSEMLLGQNELPHILRGVLQAAIDLLNADKGEVRLCSEPDDCLKVVAQVGFSEEVIQSLNAVQTGGSVAHDVVRLRKRVIIENVRCEQAVTHLASTYVSNGIAAVVSSPISASDGQILGTLSTYFSRPHRPADRELRLLDLYIRQGVHAIERSRLLEGERRARREAEQANRLKDHFLSTVSHDLRTPLNAVLGWADMLRSGRLSEARRARALQVIYDNAQRQVRLIDDLLDTSRIMSGKLKLERVAVDVSTVVQGALQVVELSAIEKAISLVADCDAEVGVVHADPARLQQVVWNLLSNAVKFTPNGGVVHVRVRRREDLIEIVVRDTGTGIAREFLPFVFEPFRQADTSTTRRYSGLGLGLAIVKHLVEAHGGTIHADSDGEGRGAAFTLHLPVVHTDRALSGSVPLSTTRESVEVEVSLLQGIAVLVVDDDADSGDLTSTSLENAGLASGLRRRLQGD